MSRIQSLVSRPKRTLAALATVLVAVGITAASGANFNASSANASNTFTAGSLTMDNSAGAGAILTAGNMKPADATTNAVGYVNIKNSGTLAGTFTLSRVTISDSTPAMSPVLNATIVDCGVAAADTDADPICDGSDLPVYNNTLAAMSSAINLGSIAPGARHRYKFTVALDGAADDTYQGKSATVKFAWDAS